MGNLSESKPDLDKLYGEYLENHAEVATDEVKNTYNAMHDAIEAHIVAVEEMFWKAGFRYAMKLAGKEVLA